MLMKNRSNAVLIFLALVGGCATARPEIADSRQCNLQPTVYRVAIGADEKDTEFPDGASTSIKAYQYVTEGNEAKSGARLAEIPDPYLCALRGQADCFGPGRSKSQPITEQADGRQKRTQLVLSGGGQHGAFGVGFLNGLSPYPEYDVVTGVSTGALQAPLALLGDTPRPKDRQLREADGFATQADAEGFTNRNDLVFGYRIKKQDALYKSKGFLGAVRKARVGELTPLRRRADILLTHQTMGMLAALPEEKYLLMALLNWDTGDVEIVDMLRLARRYARGDTNARECFIDVMIAAASEPIGAPPVMIDGNLYMDAGLRFGVFMIHLSKASAAFSDEATLYTDVIKNGDLAVKESRPAKYDILDVVGRARTILVNQVYRFSIRDILDAANTDHRVRLAYITDSEYGSGPAGGTTFDPIYMKRMMLDACSRHGRWDVMRPASASLANTQMSCEWIEKLRFEGEE